MNVTEAQSSRVKHQQAPSWDLSYVSWAPNVPLIDIQSYAFEETASRETFIYMIEDGLDPTHFVSYAMAVASINADHTMKRSSLI